MVVFLLIGATLARSKRKCAVGICDINLSSSNTEDQNYTQEDDKEKNKWWQTIYLLLREVLEYGILFIIHVTVAHAVYTLSHRFIQEFKVNQSHIEDI